MADATESMEPPAEASTDAPADAPANAPANAPAQGMDSSPYFRYDTSWPSFEEALAAFRTIAQSQGFALRIQSRRPKADNFDRVRLACSKGRKPRERYSKEETHPSRRRNRLSARLDCPFNINMKRQKYTNLWIISKIDAVHNHGCDDAGAFPQYRMAELEKHRAAILQKHAAGKKPLGIIGELQYELGRDVMFNAKDINNFLNRHKELEQDRKILFEGGLLSERQELNLAREAQRMLDLIAANKRRRTGVSLTEGDSVLPARAMTPDVTLLQGANADEDAMEDEEEV